MEYFILKPDGEQTGTYSIEQIRDMLATGFIGSDTRYWHEGITEWRPIDRIEESLEIQPPVPTAQEVAAARPQKLPVASRLIKRPEPKPHVSPGPSKKAEDQPPAPAVPTPLPSRNEPPALASPDVPHETTPAKTLPIETVRPKDKRTFNWVLYIINVTVVALAIDYAGPVAHYVWDLFQSTVTLTDSTFALVDRGQLKTFADEMRNQTMIEAVQQQINQTTDTRARAWLELTLAKARTRHTQEVQQPYLQNNEAEFIDPGTYRVLEYLDDKGQSIPHRDGAVWMAISYKNLPVYLFKAADSTQAAPPGNLPR